jgi:hypothetical protein
MYKTEIESNVIDEVDPRRRAVFVHFPLRVGVRQEPGKSFRIGLAQRIPPVRAFDLARTDVIDKDVNVSPQVRHRFLQMARMSASASTSWHIWWSISVWFTTQLQSCSSPVPIPKSSSGLPRGRRRLEVLVRWIAASASLR